MDKQFLINEYFSLTGRPISTMTVEEYLSFCEKADHIGSTVSLHRNVSNPQPIPIQSVATPVLENGPESLSTSMNKISNSLPSRNSKNNITSISQQENIEKPASYKDMMKLISG